MDSKGKFVISKERAALCINWDSPISFYTAKDAKGREDVEQYSTIFSKAIKDTHGVKLFVGNGKSIGKSKVAVYLHCKHNSRFNAVMLRHEFKADKDLSFDILQLSKKVDCNCCKFKKNF